jgi:hypothetical protein
MRHLFGSWLAVRARRKTGRTLAWGGQTRELWTYSSGGALGGIEEELAECRVKKKGRCGADEVEEVGTWQRDGKSEPYPEQTALAERRD